MQPIKILAATALVAALFVSETTAAAPFVELTVTLFEKPNYQGKSETFTTSWAGVCYNIYKCGYPFKSAKWSTPNGAENATETMVFHVSDNCATGSNGGCTVVAPPYSSATCEQLGGTILPVYAAKTGANAVPDLDAVLKGGRLTSFSTYPAAGANGISGVICPF